MGSNVNIQQTVTWTSPYVHYQPLSIGGLDPAITNANLVKQTMLGAPFTWPWNRAESPGIACSIGTQDYPQALPDFGFIEKAWITIDGDTKELTNQRTLSKDDTKGRPQYISAQNDDGAGNITFRLMPRPSKACILNVCYQKKSNPIVSLGSRWTPIPDELGYIYQFGFLALGLMVTGDVRFPIFNDRFIAHLLGAQDGLDEMQRNLFLGTWLDVMRTVQRSQTQLQQGTASRSK